MSQPSAKTDWESRFILLSLLVSTWSKDPARKVGAVLISNDRTSVSYGYNGFPRNVLDDDRLAKDELRIMLSVHAELNAILNAKFDLTGSSLYVTQPPCLDCAKAIVQKGITRVFAPAPRPASKWAASWQLADHLFQETGVQRYLIQQKDLELWDKIESLLSV